MIKKEDVDSHILQAGCLFWAYPWVVEGDPIFDAVTKSLKAQVCKLIEMVDHAYILPSAIFFLQNLERQRVK